MSTGTAAMNADPAVRPFHVDIAEEAIADLQRRIAAWRPPEREPVDDQSQGVQLATVRDLAEDLRLVVGVGVAQDSRDVGELVHDRPDLGLGHTVGTWLRSAHSEFVGSAFGFGLGDPVPLENRIQLVTRRSSARQAAWCIR
jgi:hypothetical protein